MRIEKISKIQEARQDGAICNGFLFSLNHRGKCTVYETKSLSEKKEGEVEVFAEFTLDRSDLLVPHSNAVMFGSEYYEETDEFPMFYTNIYNNYANAEKQWKGTCLVYRIQRKEKAFTTTLLQIIEIGFVEDETLWKSADGRADVRPFGNFTIDVEQNILYAFTMRDDKPSTEFFAFDLPKATAGEWLPEYQVKRVVLQKSDILTAFSCDYQHYVQGACCHKGLIYSLEGFTGSAENPPAILVIDTKKKQAIGYYNVEKLGAVIEPEMIDFEGEVCYYGDEVGNIYRLYWE